MAIHCTKCVDCDCWQIGKWTSAAVAVVMLTFCVKQSFTQRK